MQNQSATCQARAHTHTYILIDVRDFVKSEKVQKFYSNSSLKELHNKRKPSTNTIKFVWIELNLFLLKLKTETENTVAKQFLNVRIVPWDTF